MPISGYIGGAAADALDEVLQRRMREEIRLQQERQHNDQVAMQREQMASAERDRASDRAFREGQVARQDAQTLYGRTDPGPIGAQSAALFRQDPSLAPMVTGRKVIDARPIAAQSVLPGSVQPGDGPRPAALGGDITATTDTSGPQQFDVLEPTPQQGRQQKRIVDLRRITDELARAGDEGARRKIATRALGDEIELPESMIGPTITEREVAKRRDVVEERAYDDKTWKERHSITSADAARRAAEQEERMIARATRASQPDPKTQAEQRAATVDVARKLLTAPGLSRMTGAKGREYLFGLRDDPLAGSEARDAKEFFKSLQALLALPKLSYLKGPMSDKDIEFVKAAADALNPNMSDETFRSELSKILFRLENPTGDNSVFRPATSRDDDGGMRPVSSHGSPSRGPQPSQSALDILNGRRAQRQ